MEEPSVLDYVKSKLKFWQRGARIELPAVEVTPGSQPLLSPEEQQVDLQPENLQLENLQPRNLQPENLKTVAPFPWRSLLALAFALIGQRAFEPGGRSLEFGLGLYLAAAALLIWANWRGEWVLTPQPVSESHEDTLKIGRAAFIVSLLLALAAFLFLGGNLFTPLNVTLWVLAMILLIWSLWQRDPATDPLWKRLRNFLRQNTWQVRVTRWTLLVLAVAASAIFFRFYRLSQIPSEPFSDHAEKILDVYDVTQGQTLIFFPRNTGREAIQMYLTVLVSWLFGTGLSFMSLKIGTVLCGLGTLPYMVLLGKEVGNRRVGLLAMFLTGIAYWPNVISRIGLRFPLYPLFVAPTLYYLLRGLRRQNRNDFILSGIFLGLGLHGYSPFRIVPVVVVIATALYLLHIRLKAERKQAVIWLSLLALVSLFVFLPLLRYALENPQLFNYRAFSRLGDTENPLPGPALQIFLSNTWNALRMFNWDDGEIWVNSVTHRPALDVVSGALFLLGCILLLARYIRRRHWLDLFLLLSIPLLMLPSILSLAFPGENPALNRAGGAVVPVFLVVALALDGFIASLSAGRRRQWLAGLVAVALLLWSTSQNYGLVFRQFDQQFRSGAWNTSEMGVVIQQFGQTYGSTDNTWVVPYPYWVDTRLPGVWAGIPNRDFAVWPKDLATTVSSSGAKLFIVNVQDADSVNALKLLYPNGVISRYKSTTGVEGKDFMIFFVPPQ
jgi:4-amino-4-deoxy-L-arabinose transferase-like glycosyltransferase